jgi:hypothetical protein
VKRPRPKLPFFIAACFRAEVPDLKIKSAHHTLGCFDCILIVVAHADVRHI